jgi:hypothetical protein
MVQFLPTVLHGHEIWALTLWEIYKMLGKISAYRRKEINGQFRILHNEELHNLHWQHTIVEVVK